MIRRSEFPHLWVTRHGNVVDAREAARLIWRRLDTSFGRAMNRIPEWEKAKFVGSDRLPKPDEFCAALKRLRESL